MHYTSFNEIYSIVSEIWKFKKLNLKPSVSNMWTSVGYWTSYQWRQLGMWRSSDPKKWKSKKFSDHKVHRFRVILRVLWYSESISTRTPKICWIDATANYAMTQCLRFCWYDAFRKRKQNFIKSFNARWMLQCNCERQFLKEFYHRQWSSLSLGRLLRVG